VQLCGCVICQLLCAQCLSKSMNSCIAIHMTKDPVHHLSDCTCLIEAQHKLCLLEVKSSSFKTPSMYRSYLISAHHHTQARTYHTVKQSPNATKSDRVSHQCYHHSILFHPIILTSSQRDRHISHPLWSRYHSAIPTRRPPSWSTPSSTGVSGVIIKLLLYRFEVVGEESRVCGPESTAVAEEFIETLRSCVVSA